MDLATLDLEFRTDGADKALADVNRLTAAAAKAERAAGGMGSRTEAAARKAAAANDNLARSAARVTSSYDRMVVAARKVVTVVGALGGLLVGAALVRYADAWTDITSRVNIAAGSIENGRAVMERLDAMARRTYSSMSQTAESYLLNATAMRELGYSTNETLNFVEAINNALVVSGAKGDRAASVMNALSKAMATGKLSGDELNTVISVGGRVAEALAAGMGVTTNQLRALGQQGRITGDVLAKALIGQLDTLRQEADNMAATVGDGMLLIGNAILSVVGRFDQATGASAALAGMLVSVADGIKTFGDYAIRAAQIAGAVLGPVLEKIADYGDALATGFKIAGAALVGWLGPVAVGAVLSLAAAIGTTLVGAVKALTIAMMANPIGLFVGAIAAAVTAVYLFRDEIKNAIGVDVVAIGKDAANLFVGAWIGTFEAIRIVWRDLPGVMGDLAVQAGNALIAGIEGAINLLIPRIKEFYRILNPIAGLADILGGGVGDVFGTKFLDVFKADFGRFKNDFEGKAAATGKGVTAAFHEALFKDYIGIIGEVIAGTRTAEEAIADLDAKLKGAGISFEDAAEAAKKAEQEFKRFQGIADGLAEKMFPGEYARREAEELLALLDRFGEKLDVFQRAAVEARIADQFLAASLGVRELDRDTKKSGDSMKSVLTDIAGIAAGIFDGAKDSIWDWVDAFMQAAGQIGARLMSLGEQATKADPLGGVIGSAVAATRSVPAVYVGPNPASPAGGAMAASGLQGYDLPRTTAALERTSHALAGVTVSYRNAIAQIESGGRYDAVGPMHPSLGRALGKYQVMEANIGPWSQQALGRSVGVSEFLNNPAVQDAVFDKIFGGYVERFGAEGAAQAWFAGPGGVGKLGRTDVLGTSVGKYGQMFVAQLANDNIRTASVANTAAALPQTAAVPFASPGMAGSSSAAGAAGTGNAALVALGAAASGLAAGYQAQNPLMGAISGGLGGLMTGNPWAAAAGALAGVRGGRIGVLRRGRLANLNDKENAA